MGAVPEWDLYNVCLTHGNLNFAGWPVTPAHPGSHGGSLEGSCGSGHWSGEATEARMMALAHTLVSFIL